MRIRTLEPGEREALLELLDGWELPDGWRGRDFFRRYVEDDPSYRDENVWVAESAGRLWACAQIFPRVLRLGGRSVPLGGVGSVFTRPERRGAGLASAVLRRAIEAMRERRMELSLLFAARVPLYERVGFARWPAARALYRRGARRVRPAPGLALEGFDAGRDLEAVAAIHAGYSGARQGTLVRDRAAWEGSLRLAGNPREDFRVARRAGRVTAYARAAVLEGFLVLAEFGCQEEARDDLARLLAALLAPRADDPLARPGRPSEALRRAAFGPTCADAALERALAASGVRLRGLPDPACMLCCLDPAALAERLGVDAGPDPGGAELLRRVAPPERFLFWPADRF